MTDNDVITITSGPQNARIDPETELRWYSWMGQQLLSVTSARKQAGVTYPIHQWTLSQVIDRAVDHPDVIHQMLNRPRKKGERVRDKNARDEARKWLRAAATELRDQKAALGTAVHEYAAQGIVPDDVPEVTIVNDKGKTHEIHRDQVIPRLNWLISWIRVSGARILAQEFQCWNLTDAYAGSSDLLVEFPNGQTWLIDLKTGEGTYLEHAMQLAAYRHAEFVGKDDVVDERLTMLLAQVSACGVLHLNEHGWEFVKVRSDERVYQAFLHILGYATASIDIGQTNAYVLARRAFPDPVEQMSAELERITGKAAA